jgi:hypothetical protein
MQTRRSFLGTLMASIVGTAFVPSELLWVPSPEKGLPIVSPDAFLTLEAITREAARRLAQRIALPVTTAVRGDQLGDVQGHRIGDAGMTGQYGVDLGVLPSELAEHGLSAERYIAPAVACLAEAIKRQGWDKFGELALPMACDSARVTVDGVSVRGIMAYDTYSDQTLLRLDVIGGHA